MFHLSPFKFKVSPFILLIALALPAHAQWEQQKVDGIELGPKLVLKPQIEAAGNYDNRVLRALGGGAKSDFYADLAAAAEIVNRPSRYDLWIKGRYGYRIHNTYSKLDDDFYTAAASLGTTAGPLLWKLSTDYTKTLDYNTAYNPGSGQLPDSVLSQGSTRSVSIANIAYDSRRFSKTALVPSYTFQHYNQQYQYFDTSNEWQIHTGILKLRRQYSSKTRIYGGLVYGLQSSDTEDGNIATAAVGVDHRMTPKTSWMLELGYALADYELSGTDQGFVSRLRGNWQTTKKLSTYIFGGNNFQPGYSGSAARWVYRLGYGIKWQAKKKLSLRASVLHDYQEEIGNNTSSNPQFGTVRNFIDLQTHYEPIHRISLIAGIRYNQDQYDPNQTIFTLRMNYRFY